MPSITFVGGGKITLLGLVKACIFLSMKMTGLWFVAAYFWLYCMSPVINAWHRAITNRQLEVYLVCFAIADVSFGYLAGSELFSMPIHFVLLYGIGHYLRVSDRKWVKDSSVWTCFVKYAVATIILFAYAAILVVRQGEAHKSFEYLNPIITVQSIFILLIFTKINVKHSNRINYLAASAFPVYLLSENVHMRHWFVDGIQYMMGHLSMPVFIVAFAVACVCAYFVLLMADKVLGHIYKPLTNQIIKRCKR